MLMALHVPQEAAEAEMRCRLSDGSEPGRIRLASSTYLSSPQVLALCSPHPVVLSTPQPLHPLSRPSATRSSLVRSCPAAGGLPLVRPGSPLAWLMAILDSRPPTPKPALPPTMAHSASKDRVLIAVIGDEVSPRQNRRPGEDGPGTRTELTVRARLLVLALYRTRSPDCCSLGSDMSTRARRTS